MSASKPNQTTALELFGAAAGQNIISPASQNTLSAVDFGAQIQDALGVPADAIESSEVFLLAILVDDSSSIRDAGNEDNVRKGVNLALDALRGSKAENDILAHVTAMNRGMVYPFSAIRNADNLTATNYSACGSTPLYDQSIVVLGTVLAKEQELAAAGVPVRTATLIVTDGADCGFNKRPAEVASVVKDMRRRENHIVAAMGINDGTTNFVDVFKKMGLDDRWILTPGNDPKEIRRAFEVFSKSSVQASQSASLSKLQGFTP